MADLKPLAQVAPETIELPVVKEGDFYGVRLGDLLTEAPRIILANLYIDQLPPGHQAIAQAQVRYDDPATGQTRLISEAIPITVDVQENYQPAPNPVVQQSILALAKYRQTQLAEDKLKVGDRQGAATSSKRQQKRRFNWVIPMRPLSSSKMRPNSKGAKTSPKAIANAPASPQKQ